MPLTIPAGKIDELKALLQKNNYVLTEKPYLHFAAIKGSFTVDLYKNGAILLGGPNKGEKAQILRYLGVLLAPDPALIENKYPAIKVFGTRTGINSAGEGEYWGPLVWVGIFADDEQARKLLELKLQDFETLSKLYISKLAGEIKKIIPPLQISIAKFTPRQYNSYFNKHEHFNDMATIYEILESGCADVHWDLYNKSLAAKTVVYPEKLRDEEYTIGNKEYESNRLADNEIKSEPHYTWENEDLYIISPRAHTEVTVVAAGIIAKEEFNKELEKMKKPEII